MGSAELRSRVTGRVDIHSEWLSLRYRAVKWLQSDFSVALIV